MNDKITNLLEGEIERELNSLSSLNPGSEEHSKAVENLVKIYKLKIEDDKNSIDSYDKNLRNSNEKAKFDREMKLKEQQNNKDVYLREKDVDLRERQLSNDISSRENEEEFKKTQLKEQSKDRYFRLGLEIGLTMAQLIFYACWMRRGFKFEETGTYTSPTFRSLTNNFKPKRK